MLLAEFSLLGFCAAAAQRAIRSDSVFIYPLIFLAISVRPVISVSAADPIFGKLSKLVELWL